MKTPPRNMALVITAGALLAAGCQTLTRIQSVETSPVCPTCKTEERTLLMGDLIYRKHICPSCGTVRDYGDDYEHLYVPDVLHVCDRCEAVIETCPQCSGR